MNLQKKIKFREFYKKHIPEYKAAAELYMKLVPVNAIWNFTEKHFPEKVQYYNILFSPLENRCEVHGSNYDKGNFRQYTYYAATPVWAEVMDPAKAKAYYIHNSWTFYQAQVYQYLDDYYLNDTIELENIFAKKNHWAYVNNLGKNEFRPKDIFYAYVSEALFNKYYDVYLKHQFENQKPMRFNTYLLKLDDFTEKFFSVYEKYPPEKFDLVLKEMKAWCKQQK